MNVYMLMHVWCNGYAEETSMMDIYADEADAIAAKLNAEQLNDEPRVSYTIDVHPLK